MLAGKSSLTGLELCSAVEQMQTCETVQMILGDASIGDLLEKVAFNALPGGLTNDMKGCSIINKPIRLSAIWIHRFCPKLR
jgi:hypothetical protein